MEIYNNILKIDNLNIEEAKLFFVEGPGGTGKTFLYNTILAKFRSEGKIAIAVATSGIAANLLVGGQTAHSIFRIPIKIYSDSTCNININSPLAELLQKTNIIFWDEAV